MVILRQRLLSDLETQKTGHINHMKKIILVLLFGACVFPNRVSATVLSTPEHATIGGIGLMVSIYQQEHDGQLPTTWAQLGEYLNLEKTNRELASRQSSVPQPTFIQDRYQFITQPLWAISEESRVLIMRTVPLAHLENLKKKQIPIEKQWRYVVLQNKEGNIRGTRLPEKEIQEMLKKAGMTITPKPGLPAVETNERMPGAELNPQPNPVDAAYLAQHSKLDPARIAFSPTPATTPAKTEQLVPKEAPPSTAWPYILAVVLVGGLVFIIYRRRKRQPLE